MISMNDFKRQDETLIGAQMDAVERVLRSGWYVLGAEVSAFEEDWALWSGSAHAVGVGNGMDALEIGLRALGVGAGDEVITTPMTAFATVLAIVRAGAEPVFADIDAATGILDPQSVERCIGPRTKAVIVVHLYGQAAPLDRFVELTDRHGIHLVEDCAQAHGAKFAGKPVGTFGAFAGWSFYPTKNLGAIGDGGALTTEQPEIAEAARRLRNYGQSVRYHHPEIGLNSRLDEIQAAMLRERLKHLQAWTDRRRAIAHRLQVGIQNEWVQALPLPMDAESHVHHLFVVTSPIRDALQAHLAAQGIDSLCHYPIPAHEQEPCRGMRRDPLGLAVAEQHARTCLSIPCHPGLEDGEVEAIVAAVNGFGASALSGSTMVDLEPTEAVAECLERTRT
jgi:dTDP-4-amino-4,6-dideoxygalactose transaminase